MLSVTFADLVYRYRQFLIAVLGAGVVLAMALLLAGLGAGFRVEINDAVGAVGADHWVLPEGANGRITSEEVFPQSAVTALAGQPGVGAAAPLVMLPQQVARVAGRPVTVFVIGVSLGRMGDPAAVSAGSALSGPGQVVVDTRVHAGPGATIRVGAVSLNVVGRIAGRTMLGGVPIVYMPLADAQRVGLSGRAFVTAAALRGSPAAVPAGLEVVTSKVAEQQTMSALGGAVASINNSKYLMYVVATIIIAALLYVSALQRVRDFAVLKALGSSSLVLFGSLALQAVVVTLAAAGFAAAICNFMYGIFSQPVAIPTSAFATLPIIAVIVGVLSSLIALRRATGADPVAAFGG